MLEGAAGVGGRWSGGARWSLAAAKSLACTTATRLPSSTVEARPFSRTTAWSARSCTRPSIWSRSVAERKLLRLVTVDAGRGRTANIVVDDGDGAAPAPIVVKATAPGLAAATLSIPVSADALHFPLAVARTSSSSGF